MNQVTTCKSNKTKEVMRYQQHSRPRATTVEWHRTTAEETMLERTHTLLRVIWSQKPFETSDKTTVDLTEK